jgi:hypothetical protein
MGTIKLKSSIKKALTQNRCDNCGFTKDEVFGNCIANAT